MTVTGLGFPWRQRDHRTDHRTKASVGKKPLSGDWWPVAQQRPAECPPGQVPIAGPPPRKYSLKRATLLSLFPQRDLARQERCVAQSPRISRGSPRM